MPIQMPQYIIQLYEMQGEAVTYETHNLLVLDLLGLVNILPSQGRVFVLDGLLRGH